MKVVDNTAAGVKHIQLKNLEVGTVFMFPTSNSHCVLLSKEHIVRSTGTTVTLVGECVIWNLQNKRIMLQNTHSLVEPVATNLEITYG